MSDTSPISRRDFLNTTAFTDGSAVPVSLNVNGVDHTLALGIGELGAVGVAPANAVYHATGTRVRDLPIRIERVLGSA